MTRQDFETRFNSLFDEERKPSLSDIAEFRADALADYDALTAAATTTATLTSTIESLQSENKDLRDTNYKLFRMNPSAFNFTSTESASTAQTPTANTTPDTTVESISDIQAMLFTTSPA